MGAFRALKPLKPPAAAGVFGGKSVKGCPAASMGRQ